MPSLSVGRQDDWDEEQSQDDDNFTLSIPEEFRDIKATERKYTVRELFKRYTDGKLELQAEFQREYVWDEKRASRFIESLLLNLPVPSIFVAQNNDNSWDVVDGHQRLESLFGFLQPLAQGLAVNAKVRPNFRALRLRDLQVKIDLLGKDARGLPPQERAALLDKQITIIGIPKSSARELRFTLFERLNLGSVPLNAQELRNCLYHGPYNDLIKDLAADARTLEFFGRPRPHKRMKDREMVLRFFALLHRRSSYRTPFREFLNDEMEENRACDSEMKRNFRQSWVSAISWTQRVFGDQRCRLFRIGTDANPKGRWDNRWSDLIFEGETVTFAKYSAELDELMDGGSFPKDALLQTIRHSLIEVMSGRSFLRALNEGTTRPENLNDRFERWESMVTSVLEHTDAKIRIFDDTKKAFGDNKICKDCHNQIDTLEDAFLDDSARVAHRYCYSKRWS